MLFKTVNSTLEKSHYTINIKNIDLASGHWGSEREMVDYLDYVDSIYLDKETFNKNIVVHAINLLKNNLRIKDLKFFRSSNENKLILLALTRVAKFKDPEPFTREMSINIKNDNFTFSIVELVKEEYEKLESGEVKLPDSWVPDEKLTDKLNKLKHYTW